MVDNKLVSVMVLRVLVVKIIVKIIGCSTHLERLNFPLHRIPHDFCLTHTHNRPHYGV
jgi:hypothetical protein